MTLRWHAAGSTHVGRVRRSNEDTLRLDEDRGVFLVADGMGGHAAGEVASALAGDTVLRALTRAVDRDGGLPALEAVLTQSFINAHEAIETHTVGDPATRGMGTTLTALVVRPDGAYRVGHVGDSRLYLLRDGELSQLTRDHTLVQREVDAGRMTPLGARRHHLSHILTRALGAGEPEAPELMAGTVRAGDRVLLTTDGITGMLHDRMLKAFLEQEQPPASVVRMLLEASNRRGGRDNLTAIVVDFE
jgi:PPM family protein phosphatase